MFHNFCTLFFSKRNPCQRHARVPTGAHALSAPKWRVLLGLLGLLGFLGVITVISLLGFGRPDKAAKPAGSDNAARLANGDRLAGPDKAAKPAGHAGADKAAGFAKAS